jgi:hypothetical protein
MPQCCVPFCGHTTKRPYGEWICVKHWTLVDRALKREKREADKRFKACDLEREAYDAVWQRCKVQAIERAL